MDERRPYRPIIIPEPSGDELRDAGFQAHINQGLEGAIDRLQNGERREELYATARILVDTSIRFRMKKPKERDLNVERTALALSFGLAIEEPGMKEFVVETILNQYRSHARTKKDRVHMKQVVEPAVRQIHGLDPHPTQQT